MHKPKFCPATRSSSRSLEYNASGDEVVAPGDFRDARGRSELLNESSVSKRIFDILLSSLVLIICSPIFLTVAALTYLALGWPVMFRQVRAGLSMRPFSILKFRTMSNERDGKGDLLPDHLRQTRLTAIIRRLRFDELPQLILVLAGVMSFVGPRPLPIQTLSDLGAIGQLRCRVQPGLTGWAQVNGNTRLNDMQKLALDIWYVEQHNLALDVLIVAMTLKTLVLGEVVNEHNVQKAETQPTILSCLRVGLDPKG